MNSRMMDEKTAFLAMTEFLEQYWQRGHSEEIASLLGFLALQPDGMPGDPAMWTDWLASVDKAILKSRI